MAEAKHAKPPESRRQRRQRRKAPPEADPFEVELAGAIDGRAGDGRGPDETVGDGHGQSGRADNDPAHGGPAATADEAADANPGAPDGPNAATGNGSSAGASRPAAPASSGASANHDGEASPISASSSARPNARTTSGGDVSDPHDGQSPDHEGDGGDDDDEGDEGGGGGGHAEGTGAVVAALLANAAVAVAKFVGFVFTGSSSMLAESIHSVADSGNQGLLLLGGHRGRQAADQEHPFGYGRERYFWGFVVALVLFAVGSLFAIYEAIEKIGHPDEVKSPQWALGILAFALVAEGLSFRKAVHAASKAKGQAGYWQFIRRAKSPELPVVLMEDFAALMGLVFAIIGVTAATVTDDGIWDAYGTLAIGILLGIVAIILVIEMKSLLIGESASRKDVEAIRAAVEVEPAVVEIIHMRAEHIGPEELLVGTKVEFHHDLNVVEVSAAIDRVERSIRAGVPMARIIYIEPDVHDDHRDNSAFVPEHAGHIDPHDPKYASITGQHRAITIEPSTDEDDIWS